MLLKTTKKVKKMVPLPLRRRLRKAWTVTYRLNDLVTRRDNMIPWKQYALSVGGGDFEKVGNEYLEYFKTLAGLKPDQRVLDVGCGIGRMAVPLTRYLTEGRYDGFDIIESSVNWCNKRIASRYPNFHFVHVDIYNEHYNPKGKLQAANFEFPYPDDTFDFAFLVSVFTHLMPHDMNNYIRQVARVLRPGGRCLITYTLLNDESLELIEEGKSGLNFQYEFDGFRSVEKDEPETSIAYPEDSIRELYDKVGMRVIEPIHYGTWAGRPGLAYQDIVIAEKRAQAPGAAR